jgi:hypothetical protein
MTIPSTDIILHASYARKVIQQRLSAPDENISPDMFHLVSWSFQFVPSRSISLYQVKSACLIRQVRFQ